MDVVPNLKRSSPLLLGIQKTYNINPADGLYGPVTAEALRSIPVVMSDIPLEYRAAEVISLFEMGPGCHNVWYARSTVANDGAGKNYGFFQANRFGSLQTMRKMYHWDNVEEFFASPICVLVQWEYFCRYIIDPVVKFGFHSDNDFLCKCDALVQGGTLYPSRPPRTWEGTYLDAGDLQTIEALYGAKTVREAFIEASRAIPEAFCEIHPLSGNPRYLTDQRNRRRTCYYGKGNVHGDLYDLSYFGFDS